MKGENCMRSSSIIKNSIYSGIKSFLSIAFPLITIKYASEVLGASLIGRVEFVRSFVSYFLLAAGLGIEGLAIRNGSALRTDKKKLVEFSNSVFSLNLISAFFAVVLLYIIAKLVVDSGEYGTLILVFAFQIPLSVIGVEWIFYIFEDFRYIAIRTISCQVISLVFLFTFVNNETDVVGYAVMLLIATYGANIFSFFSSRKYLMLQPRINKNSLRYFPAAILLFFNKIATTIYVNSDITILGILSGTVDVGLYSIVVKIYTAVKILISAVLNVTMPKLTYSIQNNRKYDYDRLTNLIIKALILIIPPIIIGMSLQSKNLILLVSGKEFLAATPALMILSIAILFSSVAMFCSASILMPRKKERVILKSTIVGAIINIVLNFLVIPILGFVGAAITTMLSELAVSLFQLHGAWSTIKTLNLNLWTNILSSIVGCLAIVCINFIVKYYELSYFLELFVTVIFSIGLYFTIQILMKNDLLMLILRRVKK